MESMSMEFDLQNATQPSYDLDRSRRNGGIPEAMIMAKFEETDIDGEETDYDNYARSVASDWGPDTSRFEHEESRGGNGWAGRLQAQYHGHRGNTDIFEVYRPEMFDSFTDHDPRGIATEPDMQKLRAQHEARHRFVRFTADGCDNVTGGSRSEAKIREDNQTLFKTLRDRLKVFSRSLKGRDNRKAVIHRKVSLIGKQLSSKCYGDTLNAEHTMSKQRKAIIICKEILRDTAKYRAETADTDFAMHRYTRNGKSGQRSNKRALENKNNIDSLDNTNVQAEDTSKCFKTAALLMSNLVSAKRQCKLTGDSDMSKSASTITSKHGPLRRDLAAVLGGLDHTDVGLGHSDATISGKGLTPTNDGRIQYLTTNTHSTPAHHLLNAEIIYKSVKMGNVRKCKDLIIRDATSGYTEDIAQRAKSAKRTLTWGAKLRTAGDTDYADSGRCYNYKTKKITNGDRAMRLITGQQSTTESDLTQMGKVNHVHARIESLTDTVRDMRYGENTYKERSAGVLGSKYTARYVDREDSNGISNDMLSV
jgi:hypothetical protein